LKESPDRTHWLIAAPDWEDVADDQQRRFARRIADAVGGLAGKRIALLGLAFKANTDDARSSPALRLAARLLDEGADVRAHDPAADDNARRMLPDLVVVPTAKEALQGADAAVIATEWPVYRDLDSAALRGTMRRPLIIDGRRLLPMASCGRWATSWNGSATEQTCRNRQRRRGGGSRRGGRMHVGRRLGQIPPAGDARNWPGAPACLVEIAGAR
jgi:hypothetical protein